MARNLEDNQVYGMNSLGIFFYSYVGDLLIRRYLPPNIKSRPEQKHLVSSIQIPVSGSIGARTVLSNYVLAKPCSRESTY